MNFKFIWVKIIQCLERSELNEQQFDKESVHNLDIKLFMNVGHLITGENVKCGMWNVHRWAIFSDFQLSTWTAGLSWTNENLILCKFTFRLKRVFENIRSGKIVSDWLHIVFSVQCSDSRLRNLLTHRIRYPKKKTLITKYLQWKLHEKKQWKGKRTKEWKKKMEKNWKKAKFRCWVPRSPRW